jgi:MOSC domain-containing protein YiiM
VQYMTPQLAAVAVGMPTRRGLVGSKNPMERPFESGIFKEVVSEPVWLGKINLAGDGQADLDNHGGPFRAVLAYGADHYPAWREELNMPDLPYGGFGENFTITELSEENVCLGDIYAIGEVQIQVTQPRMPCWKLGRRWNMKTLPALVQKKGWGGWYHRVLNEGIVEAGMPVKLVDRPYPQYPILKLFALMYRWREDADMAAELSTLEVLSPSWRETFERYAAEAGVR